MKNQSSGKYLFVPALVVGVVICWIDSRPGWDDTGVTAMMILASAMLFGYRSGNRPWLQALAISGWIPLYGILVIHNSGSLLALPFGFAGTYTGWLLKKISLSRKP